MYNNTFFEYYRNAIKAKYEREKDEDPVVALSSITTAKLRDLSIKRFKSNTDEDDLDAFLSFFEFSFDPDKKNLIKDKSLNKLKSIRRFFLGLTEDPTKETIDFAAVLLDFQPRHFYKFSKVMEGKTEDEIKQELDKKYNDPGSEIYTEETEGSPEIIKGPIIQTQGIIPTVKNEEIPEAKKFLEKLKRNKVSITAIIFFSLIAGYFIFFNKGCMQWSDNHFEVVNCKQGIEGNPNEIIQYNGHLLDFKKIPVCDTTTWIASGKSIIWYAKTDNQVDFFTICGNGRHPESGSTLRPVTKHIFNKYKKPCNSK